MQIELNSNLFIEAIKIDIQKFNTGYGTIVFINDKPYDEIHIEESVLNCKFLGKYLCKNFEILDFQNLTNENKLLFFGRNFS